MKRIITKRKKIKAKEIRKKVKEKKQTNELGVKASPKWTKERKKVKVTADVLAK